MLRSTSWAAVAAVLALAPSTFPGPPDEDLARYRAPSENIDSEHPAIVARARLLTAGRSSDLERLRALYEFARDSWSTSDCEGFLASHTLRCGGNSCRQRAILLAALARAAGLPARLRLQKVTLLGWRDADGALVDLTFAHGITEVQVDGIWRLLEPVGNPRKWVVWTQDETRAKEMPLPFNPDGDSLFPPDARMRIELLPQTFLDRSQAMVTLIETLDLKTPSATRRSP